MNLRESFDKLAFDLRPSHDHLWEVRRVPSPFILKKIIIFKKINLAKLLSTTYVQREWIRIF